MPRDVQWLGLHLRVVCRTFSLFEPPAEIAPRIDEFRPHLIRGYGSYIEELYTHLALGTPLVSQAEGRHLCRRPDLGSGSPVDAGGARDRRPERLPGGRDAGSSGGSASANAVTT